MNSNINCNLLLATQQHLNTTTINNSKFLLCYNCIDDKKAMSQTIYYPTRVQRLTGKRSYFQIPLSDKKPAAKEGKSKQI